MITPKTDSELIAEMAALLFWRIVGECDLDTTLGYLSKTKGQDLPRRKLVGWILDYYPDCSALSDPQMNDLIIKAMDQVIEATSHKAVPQGLVTDEIWSTARNKSCLDVDVSHLNQPPTKLIAMKDTGQRIERFGKLCIRPPLPPIVLSPHEPSGEAFAVKDTESALGFYHPIVIAGYDIIKLDRFYCCINGTSFVAVPNSKTADGWRQVIPTLAAYTRDMRIAGDRSSVNLMAEW